MFGVGEHYRSTYTNPDNTAHYTPKFYGTAHLPGCQVVRQVLYSVPWATVTLWETLVYLNVSKRKMHSKNMVQKKCMCAPACVEGTGLWTEISKHQEERKRKEREQKSKD